MGGVSMVAFAVASEAYVRYWFVCWLCLGRARAIRHERQTCGTGELFEVETKGRVSLVDEGYGRVCGT